MTMKVIREINRGGFGVVHEVRSQAGVHLARKTFEPRVVALDELEKLRRRFEREVRIQSQIRHPNIMPIVGHDLNASPPWFDMPLATESLEAKIARDHASGVQIDPSPWQDILAAVEELHRLGYVHRDLKPANILDVGGTWMLADFGLILPLARDTTILTSSHSAYGSHFYAAPEQAYDFRNTPEQADIFALGCILHDAIDATARRIPYAQIRTVGPYGPLLEKCTEADPQRRFPTITSLRAAVFDLWRTAKFAPPSADEVVLIAAVEAESTSIDAWRALINHMEGRSVQDQDAVCRAMTSELIATLSGIDEILFARLVGCLCDWASGVAFDFSYCDVVGDRLLEAYRMGSVRVKVPVVIAALELAVSHNRWHVMKQVGAMLSPAADNGLVDRMLIEMNLNPSLERGLRSIEGIVRWSRDRWHERIAMKLSEVDATRSD